MKKIERPITDMIGQLKNSIPVSPVDHSSVPIARITNDIPDTTMGKPQENAEGSPDNLIATYWG